MECEHEYEPIKGELYKYDYSGFEGFVYKKVKCSKCGNIGKEIYTYSCTED